MERIEHAVAAFRHGSGLVCARSPIADGRLFEECLWSQLVDTVSVEDLSVFRDMRAQVHEALCCGRHNDIDQAIAILRDAASRVDRAGVSDLARVLMTSFLEAGAAYVDYRRECWQAATTRLEKALELDRVLEEQCGLTVLHLHRLQLVHNYVRVTAKRGDLARALDLAELALKYVTGVQRTMSMCGEWDSEALTETSVELRGGLAVQMATEIAYILVCCDQQDESMLFSRCDWWHHVQTMPQTTSVWTWGALKEAFVCEPYEVYRERVTTYLADGPANDLNAPLWWLSVVDFKRFCDVHHPEVAAWLRFELQDTAIRQRVPQRLYEMFSAPRRNAVYMLEPSPV